MNSGKPCPVGSRLDFRSAGLLLALLAGCGGVSAADKGERASKGHGDQVEAEKADLGAMPGATDAGSVGGASSLGIGSVGGSTNVGAPGTGSSPPGVGGAQGSVAGGGVGPKETNTESEEETSVLPGEDSEKPAVPESEPSVLGDSGTPSSSLGGAEIALTAYVLILTNFFPSETRFTAAVHESLATPVTVENVDHCQVVTAAPAPVNPDPPALRTLSAGVIQFFAQDLVDSSLTYSAMLSPMEDGTYGQVSYDPEAMRGGALARISATGGDVPAFDVMMELPLSLLLTSPVATLKAPGEAVITVAREADLVLEWDRGTPAGKLQVLGRGDAEGGRVTLRCVFPSEEGRGTIPVELLRQFPGEGLELSTITTTPVEWELGILSVGASREVLLPDKSAKVVAVIE